jgi:ribonuclease R
MSRRHRKSKQDKKNNNQTQASRPQGDKPVTNEPQARSQAPGSLITGRVKRNPDGFGFLLPDNPDHVDVYLPRHTMTGVMTDDQVEVRTKREREDRFSGEIVRITKHAMVKAVGRYKHEPIDGSGVIIDDSKGWGENIKISRENAGGARESDLVALEILTYPGDPKGFTAKVTEKDWQGRKDLRDKKFVTIDGATARDFDDAVYAEPDEKVPGAFRVWVAIADVSHYVPEGNALDRDAYERGTSVYFPDMVVPMLPEKLSNGLCSLNPHLPRLAMVCEMKLNAEGHVVATDIYEAVFESAHRLTYGEVEDMVNGHKNAKYEDVFEGLSLLRDIAKILMRNRFQNGSLDLEIPEAQLVIDASGVPTDVVRGERLFAHRLIEELMLLANVEVAKFIEKAQVPALYRIHEEPFPNALKALEVMAHNWGVKVRFESQKGDSNIQKNLMKLLKHVEGKPEANILSMLILRSMKQAQYSSENRGHFGLAFKTYTHFTSPIRRYPDLVVHRVLKKIINRQKLSEKDKEAELAHMTGMGTFLSACEQRSTKAERELKSIKRCRFMQRHIGEEFDGMITGVVKFGIFVQLRAYDIDGLVKLDTLRGDRFEYDDVNQKLVGRRTGTIISLGDMVHVRVMRADPDKREIDFEWIDQAHANSDNGTTTGTDDQERSEVSSHRSGVRNPRVSKRPGASKTGSVHSKKDSKNRRNRKAKRG